MCMEHDTIHRSKLHWKWYAVKNATSLTPEAMAIESKINSDQPHKVWVEAITDEGCVEAHSASADTADATVTV